jgi:hypothetical protein
MTPLAGAVDSKKKNGITQPISGQQLGEHVPAEMDMQGNRRAVFSIWSMPRSYNQDSRSNDSSVEFYKVGWEEMVL